MIGGAIAVVGLSLLTAGVTVDSWRW